MRKIIFTLCFIGGLLSCKTTKSSHGSHDCKQKLKTKLDNLSSLITGHQDGTYTVNYQAINVPDGFDTIRWQTEVEILTNLDSIHTKNMLLREEFKSLVGINHLCKLDKDDFIESIGKPTEYSEFYNHFTYWFNNQISPNCYDKSNILQGVYKKCSLLQFSFDDKDQLDKVSTVFFGP